MLVVEQVDRDRLLKRLAEQIEQDEKFAMMYADLGDAARDSECALMLAQGDDGARCFAAQPAVDVEHAATNVVIDFNPHRRNLATARVTVNEAAMTVL